MAKLVESLVAGIAGAASGTATFVLRGTASSAASVLYNDFEMTSQSGTNIITLDSNGCAEVYVNAYCDMTLKTQAGVTLRTVTVGDAATSIEVISDSFTGTSYSGSPTAVSQPITLAAILDKWDNSAGADDWKVSIGGVATNLSSAFASFAGFMTNVKDPVYGAVGDGVVDDTSAIRNAIAAANGGIVFFPPGTYAVTDVDMGSDANIYLLGAGAGISIINNTNIGATLLNFTDNTTSATKIVENLGFSSSVSFLLITEMESGQNVFFKNCKFDATNATLGVATTNSGSPQSRFVFTECQFIIGANCNYAIQAGLATESQFYFVSNCSFTVLDGFTGAVILGAHVTAKNCLFDASAVTAGTFSHIDSESQDLSGVYIGTFIGNKFLGGNNIFETVFKLTNLTGTTDLCKFRESDNTFDTIVESASISDTSRKYSTSLNASFIDGEVYRGSRKGRVSRFTVNSGSSATVNAFHNSETVIINYTVAGNYSFVAPTSLMPGERAVLIVLNNNASPRDFTFSAGGFVAVESAVPSGGKAVCEWHAYNEVAGAALVAIINTKQAAT